MACRITNLAECIVEKLNEYLASIVNAPLTPLLSTIKLLLTQQPNIQALTSLWSTVVYVISVFYGLFILFAGINLIISGSNAEKRVRAKEWLQNTLLMMFFVQASYYIYTLVTQVSSGLATTIINMIDPKFFLLTLDNPISASLEILLGLFYAIILFTTVIVFSINYLLTSLGVVFLPIGIFFYFTPPLRDLGRFIINKIMFVNFLPFFTGLILLGTSQLAKNSNLKIILLISAFTLTNTLYALLAILAVFRSVTRILRSDAARGITFLKGNVLPNSDQKQETQREWNKREYWRRPYPPPYDRYPPNRYRE